MGKYKASPYTVTSESKITKITYPREKRKYDEPATPVAIGEHLIERMLYRYGLMTRQLLERAVLLSGEKKIDTGEALKIMLRHHKAEEYHMEEDSGESPGQNPDLIFYKLSRAVEKGMKNSIRTAYRYDLADPASVANLLITTQWHIAMLESGAKEIKLHGHVEGERPGVFIPVPSLTRYKTRDKRSLVFAAMPAPRGALRRSLGAFLKNITELSMHFESHPNWYKYYCVVILCDSQDQIEELSKIMASFKETKSAFVLYSPEYATRTRGEKPQKLLSYVKRSEGMTSLINIDLS